MKLVKSYSWCCVDFEFQSSVHWTRKRGENVPRRDQSSHTIWLGKYWESPHTQKDKTHLLHWACYDKYWFPVWQSRNEKQKEMMVNEPDTIKYNIPFSFNKHQQYIGTSVYLKLSCVLMIDLHSVHTCLPGRSFGSPGNCTRPPL